MRVNADEMMQAIIGSPSQTPNSALPPTSQPAAEAPPVGPPGVFTNSTSTFSVGGIVGLVLAVAVVCAALATLLFCKLYDRRKNTSPASPKAETADDHVEDPSASSLVPKQSTNIVAGEDDNKRKLLAYAVDRSFCLFPLLLEGKSRDDFGLIHFLKLFLLESVQSVLFEDSSLGERSNGPSLCSRLGMDPKMIEQRFKALISIEKELGIVGKSSFVDTINLLIEYIEVKNPFGAVNDEIQVLDHPTLSHICVKANRHYLMVTIQEIKRQLQGKGWSNLFMHGTKASIPKRIAKDPARNNLPLSIGKQDFGVGRYFFRDDVIAAFSYAMDRAFILGENPCVVTFPEPECTIDKSILDVNREKINMQKLRKHHLRNEMQFNELNNAQQHWDQKEKNWKIAVALSRWYEHELARIYRGNPKILMGWHHDSNTTAATDNGAEPIIDADEWIQYCVKDLYVLGEKMLFIEFMVNWSQWGKDLEGIEGEVALLWRQHMAEQVRVAS